uniref:Uncharacterized protein n=1 Tax=Heterorhabditis bacteriophora TaxID=37862 RepID=A0A1I7XCN5_HETBA
MISSLVKVLKRMIRVDHVEDYKVPRYKENADEETKRLWEKGCAPEPLKRIEYNEEEIERQRAAEEAARNIQLPLDVCL